MKTFTLIAACVVIAINSATPVLAKGMIKGAVVGATAGHFVGRGHAKGGAVAGAMIGHHRAAVRSRHH
jgi:outer membrane lipoprotein SlyB